MHDGDLLEFTISQYAQSGSNAHMKCVSAVLCSSSLCPITLVSLASALALLWL